MIGLPIHQEWGPPASLMEAVSGDDSLMAELIDSFQIETDARIGQMREALTTMDFPRIRFEAHTIRGAARTVGADSVAEACQQIEDVSNLQDAGLIAVQLNRVQALFEEVLGAMAYYADGRRAGSQ